MKPETAQKEPTQKATFYHGLRDLAQAACKSGITMEDLLALTVLKIQADKFHQKGRPLENGVSSREMREDIGYVLSAKNLKEINACLTGLEKRGLISSAFHYPKGKHRREKFYTVNKRVDVFFSIYGMTISANAKF